MIVKRIKPKMRPGPARAKVLSSYCKGRSAEVQSRALETEITAVAQYLKAIRSTPGGMSSEQKKAEENANEYLQILLRSSEVMDVKMAIADRTKLFERGSMLVDYATRMDKQIEPRRVSVGGIDGISTGETFYAGVMSPHTADKEFERYAASSKRGGHPIDHYVYSWPASEQPSNEIAIEAANLALQQAGVPDDCPRIIGVHHDTDNLHIHVVLSRYRPLIDKVWSTERLIDKLHKGCRAAEVKFGFSHDNGNYVVSEKNDTKSIIKKPYQFSNLSASAREVEQRHGTLSFERFVRDYRQGIELLLARAQSWNELHTLLAENLGIGIKRHGKGYVITDLSSATKDTNCKASCGGLGGPTVEARLAAWQPASSMKELRKLAATSKYSYAAALKVHVGSVAERPTPVVEINIAARQQRTDELRVNRQDRGVICAGITAVYSTRIGDAPDASARKSIRIARDIELKKAKEKFKARELEIRDAHKILRERTAVEKGAGRKPYRDSDCTLSSYMFRVRAIFVVEIAGYKPRELPNGKIQYLLGGVPVLIDDGQRIEVKSNMKSHIRDGLRLLLERDPGAAQRGITLTGTAEFKKQAILVIAAMGLKLNYGGKEMKADFDLYEQVVTSTRKETQQIAESDTSSTNDVQQQDGEIAAVAAGEQQYAERWTEHEPSRTNQRSVLRPR
jgi:hypothetical protein